MRVIRDIKKKDITNNNNNIKPVTVKLERHIYERLKTLLIKKQMMGVKNTVNQITKNYVIREEIFFTCCPYLSILSWEGNTMYIRDEKIGKVADVIVRYVDDKTAKKIELYCMLCNTDYCVHTACCGASDKLGELDIINKHYHHHHTNHQHK